MIFNKVILYMVGEFMKTQIDMTELKNIPKNGHKVISTFSGCGGSSLGYKLAGYNVKCAVEFIPKASETYSANFPDTPVIEKDVRDITGEDLMKLTEIKKYEDLENKTKIFFEKCREYILVSKSDVSLAYLSESNVIGDLYEKIYGI